MKIAVFADMHLPAAENTPQEAALDWALQNVREIQPDAVAVLGDITCCGSTQATLRCLQKLQTLPCPILTLPGNSDLRTPGTAAVTERLLTAGRQVLAEPGLQVVGLNLSHNLLPAEERARLEGLSTQDSILLVSHQGPMHLDEASRSFLQNWIQARTAAGQKIIGWIFGHIHLVLTDTFAGVPLLSLCALDPDKNAGDYPQMLTVFAGPDKFGWIPHRFTEGLPTMWPRAERMDFSCALGISCYDPVNDMPQLLRSGARNMEWRSVPKAALPLLARWRALDGLSFSVHLPGVSPDIPESITAFAAMAAQAAAVRPDFVTIHPPQIASGRLAPGQALFDRFADTVARALTPLRDVGTRIVVENNHTPFGSSREPAEIDFGCTPADVVLWRDALALRLGNCMGLRLDIGHARNNVPVSEEYPLGAWYALLGQQFDAYHLHQTAVLPDGSMQNHLDITGWHAGLISLDGFLWGWHTGLLRHGPAILEIRHGDPFQTFARLLRLLRDGTDR